MIPVLFLENLSASANEERLYRLFSVFGRVLSVSIFRDVSDSSPLGIACVYFQHNSESQKAASFMKTLLSCGQLEVACDLQGPADFPVEDQENKLNAKTDLDRRSNTEACDLIEFSECNSLDGSDCEIEKTNLEELLEAFSQQYGDSSTATNSLPDNGSKMKMKIEGDEVIIRMKFDTGKENGWRSSRLLGVEQSSEDSSKEKVFKSETNVQNKKDVKDVNDNDNVCDKQEENLPVNSDCTKEVDADKQSICGEKIGTEKDDGNGKNKSGGDFLEGGIIKPKAQTNEGNSEEQEGDSALDAEKKQQNGLRSGHDYGSNGEMRKTDVARQEAHKSEEEARSSVSRRAIPKTDKMDTKEPTFEIGIKNENGEDEDDSKDHLRGSRTKAELMMQKRKFRKPRRIIRQYQSTLE